MVDVSPTRKLTVIAKDPGLRMGGSDGPIAFIQVPVPAEPLGRGPAGYRVKVVDYNASEGKLYYPNQSYEKDGVHVDPFAPGDGEAVTDKSYEERLISDPNFHAQNVYAIAMRTLGTFERALGRRVAWSSAAHQLLIAPHAFAQANAFYSEADRALMFGYFYDSGYEPVFTCLSHDIVAHETTHALLDGLRSNYTEASGPDQAAFHEGFADIVALLSQFSLEPVVAAALGEDGKYVVGDTEIVLVDPAKLTPAALKRSDLFGLAKQFGVAIESGRHNALRRSIKLTPEAARAMREGRDEHDRGEVIVAAMMAAFLGIWCDRITRLGQFEGRGYSLTAVIDEGAKTAKHLLNMAIRALDYCPPTDMDFGQYLASLLTADRELVKDDELGYRKLIVETFANYGIVPPAAGCTADHCWEPFPEKLIRIQDAVKPGDRKPELIYARSNYAEMTRSKDEMFRFLWENRAIFGIDERAETTVVSLDTALRIDPDGIALTETICQYVQSIEMFTSEFKSICGIQRPDGMDTKTRLDVYGGGVVVLDQYGQVKYHICNPLRGGKRQQERARYLFETGRIGRRSSPDAMRFAMAHLERMGA